MLLDLIKQNVPLHPMKPGLLLMALQDLTGKNKHNLDIEGDKHCSGGGGGRRL